MAKQNIFAIIVGIDKYISPEIPDLSGCVTDAHSFQRYIIDDLNIPSENIVMLQDDGATRQEILNALQKHFVANSSISRGDAMLFYFAGHGSQCIAPDGWTTDDGMVETISPHDENTVATPHIYGIPDRTLSAILHKAAEARGNNITTILDCCHSGSGTRGKRIGNVRGFGGTVKVPLHLDGDIWANVAERPPKSGFLGGNLSTHVLLAACRQDEEAREIPAKDGCMKGAFTNELLKVLRQISLKQTTYAALLDLLPPLREQHPQCEGNNKHCRLFTTTPHHDDGFFRVSVLSSSVIEVDAGKAHGVTDDAEFTLYENASTDSPPLGVFRVDSLKATSSTLIPKNHQSIAQLPHKPYALVSRWASSDAKLAVFFDARSTSIAVANKIGHLCMMAPLNVIRASRRSKADVTLHEVTDNSSVVKMESFIGSHSTVDVPLPNIKQVLQAASHFKFHFTRTNEHHPLRPQVTMELHRLTEDNSGLYKPTGPNQISEGHAHIVLTDDYFGITLRNHSDHDLFPSLFIFDPAGLSIRRWYVPPSRTMAAPLRHGSTMTVGYGNNDGSALKFSLNPRHKTETSFLVLFLSTMYADMKHIENNGASQRGATLEVMQKPGMWDTVRATITVGRTNGDLECYNVSNSWRHRFGSLASRQIHHSFGFRHLTSASTKKSAPLHQ